MSRITQTASFAAATGRQCSVLFAALAIAALVLWVSGYDPLAMLVGIYKSIASDFGDTLRWSIPLILTGLAVSAAFRAGVWNLGVDGQLYLGAMAATVIGLQFAGLPFPLSVITALLAGIVAGALWAALAGLLRVRWGANEVVTTLFLNFIAILLTDYLVLQPLKGTGMAAGTSATNKLAEHFWLSRLLPPSQANAGLFLAILVALLLAFLFWRTSLGYEFNLTRQNPRFARYGGINVKRVIMLSMLLSGAIAGLAGAVEILGVHHRFPGRFSHGLGFDGIVVALLAKNNPLGVLLAGFFFGALRNGAMNMERVTDVPRAMVEIVQAIIVLLVSAQFAWTAWLKPRVSRHAG